jgi:putative membrane protein
MRKTKAFMLGSVLLLGGAAGAQQPQQLAGKATTQSADANAMVPVPSEPKAFVERLRLANRQEQEFGALAQERGVSPQVREFGRLLASEHQANDQQLQSLATQKNWNLGDPRPMDDNERAIEDAGKADLARLRALRGPAFDRAFLATMVNAHDLNIARVQAAQQRYREPELSPLLEKTRRTLMQHREQAYRLLGAAAIPAT